MKLDSLALIGSAAFAVAMIIRALTATAPDLDALALEIALAGVAK